MPDINRDVSIEQVDYEIDVNNIEYSIEINPQNTYEIQLNEQGPQGLTGPQGKTGATGETGNGIASIVQTGTSGLIDEYTIYYTDGDTYSFDVTNGKDGTDGRDGVDGQAATIEVGTVSTGAAGTGATVVNVGTSSEAIFDFVIPKGEKGDQGIQGSVGPAGTAATIAVGNVSTGAAGTSASVVNTGTTSAAVFDFTIPKGDKGDTGSVGATGTGITTVTLESTVGLANNYRMHFSDGNYYDYTVMNGAAGSTDWGGISGTLSNQTDLQNALNGKQDTLTAGNNISISGGTISATDTTYSAGYGIDISSGTISTSTTIASKTDIPTATSDLLNDSGYITGINSSDVTTALGYTPVNSSSLATVATTGTYADLVGTPTIGDGAITFTQGSTPIGTITANQTSASTIAIAATTVDQTYSATSTNAQSGVAINDAKFLRNTAGNATSLTVFGNPSNSGTGNAINIGYSSTALNSGDIAIGRGSNARGSVSIALGFDATVSNSCSNAIQLGTGTNSTANTFNVGFRNVNNYQLLDGTTGYIPNARINMDTTVTASSTNAITSGAVSTALGNKQDSLTAGSGITISSSNTISTIAMVIEDFTT